MREEYDFSDGVRGKYTDRFVEGLSVAVLDPDVAAEFQFPDINSIRLKLDGSCKKFGNAIQSLRCETVTRTEL